MHTAVAVVNSGDDAIAIAVGNLSDGLGLGLSLTLAIDSIASIASIAVASGDEAGVANVVGVASGIGIGDGKAISHLSDGVGLGLSLGLTLAIKSISSISSIAIAAIAMGDVAGISNIVRVPGSIGIGNREAISNLSNGVGLGLGLGLRLSLSLTLAINSITSIASIASIAKVSTVSNGTVSRDESIAIVDTSDDSVAIAMGNLPDGVRLRPGIRIYGGGGQKNNGCGSHLDWWMLLGPQLTSTGPH